MRNIRWVKKYGKNMGASNPGKIVQDKFGAAVSQTSEHYSYLSWIMQMNIAMSRNWYIF